MLEDGVEIERIGLRTELTGGHAGIGVFGGKYGLTGGDKGR